MNVTPVCGKCAKLNKWIELVYLEEKKPCFLCGKLTSNYVGKNWIKLKQ